MIITNNNTVVVPIQTIQTTAKIAQNKKIRPNKLIHSLRAKKAEHGVSLW